MIIFAFVSEETDRMGLESIILSQITIFNP